VSLELQAGERLTLIGPNGAGKTTFFNVVCGILRAHIGSITLNGSDVSALPAHKRARLGLGRGFQITNLFPELSVWDTAVIAAVRRARNDYRCFAPLHLGSAEREEVEATLKQWRFDGMRDTRVRELPYGEQRRLDICLALMMKPSVLLLDEPTAGLSGDESIEITQMVKSLPRSLSCLVVTHDLSFGFGIADRVVGMNQGQIVTEGSPEQVRADDLLQKMYF
jgi:branched-chain amino acid transport system ATP-binding protein